MSGGGRPLRFLAVVVGGWVAVRIAMLWPPAESAPVPVAAAIDSPRILIGRSDALELSIAAATSNSVTNGAIVLATRWSGAEMSESLPASAGEHRTLAAADNRAAAPFRFVVPAAGVSLPLAPRLAANPRPSRWQSSGWLVVRGGGGSGVAFGGSQLGGSQAGVRIAYTIDRSDRLAIAGRISTPLRGEGREVAVGIEWQPTTLPVRLVAEQRVSLDGGRGGPAVGMIGGIGPAPVLPATTVEAYAQVGVIARDGVEGFADGAVRAAHGLFDLGDARFDLGAAVWGAAQRGAGRLDVGPSLSADLPIGSRAHVRLSLDWRARIVGDVQPDSGLVVSLGTDF